MERPDISLNDLIIIRRFMMKLVLHFLVDISLEL
jgi:hypothetical protein